VPTSRLSVIFGANVRRIRLTKGWSQEDLAHQVGVHRNFIGALERGERNPTLVSVEKVAVALGVDPADMLRDSVTTVSTIG
jgi:transcriptional regulator with XRE-family HTH domain